VFPLHQGHRLICPEYDFFPSPFLIAGNHSFLLEGLTYQEYYLPAELKYGRLFTGSYKDNFSYAVLYGALNWFALRENNTYGVYAVFLNQN
jgi:hypothetical protein